MFEWNGEIAFKTLQYPDNALERQAFRGGKDGKQEATENEVR